MTIEIKAEEEAGATTMVSLQGTLYCQKGRACSSSAQKTNKSKLRFVHLDLHEGGKLTVYKEAGDELRSALKTIKDVNINQSNFR